MYNYIPPSITWSVNNKVIWELYYRERMIDSSLDVNREWISASSQWDILKDLWETITKEWNLLTDGFLQTTEPVEVNERDLISLQVNYGLNPTMSICKIWIKNIDVSFQSFDYALKMISRKDPQGRDLGLVPNLYTCLRCQTPFTGNRDQWLYLMYDN